MKKDKEKFIKEAAAISYSPHTDQAPRLVAAGKGEAAEKIVQTARENSIPIQENAELAHSLGKMNRGDEIPSELYAVVAEVLAYIGSMDGQYREMEERHAGGRSRKSK